MSSFCEPAKTTNSTYANDGLKNPQKYNKNFGKKNFIEKIFSTQKCRETSIFGHFWSSEPKSINLVSLRSSIDVRMHIIAQNVHNTILLKWVKKISKSPPPPKKEKKKNKKNQFFGPKMA